MTEPWNEGVSLAWLQSFLIYGSRRQLIERNLRRWGQPRMILEAGSGPAHDSLIFAERGSAVTAVDLSLLGVQAARRIFTEQCLPIQVCGADILDLPFSDGCFDLAWNAGTLEHFDRDDDLQRALCEMARVTRVSGTVLVLVPNRHYFWYQWHLRRMKRRDLKRQYEFERSFSVDEMQAWFKKVGLQNIHVSGDHIHPSPEFLLPYTGRLTAALRWLFAPFEKNGDGWWKAVLGLDIAVWGQKG